MIGVRAMIDANTVRTNIPKTQDVVPENAGENPGLDNNLYDFRFRALLPRAQWNALPAAVQRRFSKRLSEGRVALYAGMITETRFSKLGWILAQTLRLIGAPLPVRGDTGRPAVVNVAEDPEYGGQLWTRVYHHAKGFPQTINSAKRFAGKTGLEEHIGFGIGMALNVCGDGSGLTFTSDHYFINLAGLRLHLPKWMTPGKTEVCHIDRGNGAFDFTLRLTHTLFGELLYQAARFQDQ
jgi:Domain of unknown function (DUF4166)